MANASNLLAVGLLSLASGIKYQQADFPALTNGSNDTLPALTSKMEGRRKRARELYDKHHGCCTEVDPDKTGDERLTISERSKAFFYTLFAGKVIYSCGYSLMYETGAKACVVFEEYGKKIVRTLDTCLIDYEKGWGDDSFYQPYMLKLGTYKAADKIANLWPFKHPFEPKPEANEQMETEEPVEMETAVTKAIYQVCAERASDCCTLKRLQFYKNTKPRADSIERCINHFITNRFINGKPLQGLAAETHREQSATVCTGKEKSIREWVVEVVKGLSNDDARKETLLDKFDRACEEAQNTANTN